MSGKPKSKILSYLGFGAWVVYGLLGAREYWRTAACAGLVIMLAIVAYEIRTPSVKIIDRTSLAFFLLATVELATIGEVFFNRYEVVFGWGLFAGVAWVTMIAGVPLRLERAPHELWTSQSFAGFISA